MSEHIGIAACSAEGASLCYRTICEDGDEFLGPYGHPEISMYTPPFSEFVRALDAGDWTGVGELMLSSAVKLAAIGANFVICPDNTIHRALPLFESRSPLPWMHIAEIAASEAAERGFRHLAILGTRWLMEGDVYPQKLSARGLAYSVPGAGERASVHRIIMDELVRGRCKPQSVAQLQRIIERMKDVECDAVILGCTELPLVLGDANSPLPTLDSTRLLARAALRRAVGSTVASSRRQSAAAIPPRNENRVPDR
jgi:aspartate racemase